ncbi:MAG: MFS transporter [Chloroflexi bacterium]|nr:MFS transporter [Chloroflexota bacterium]
MRDQSSSTYQRRWWILGLLAMSLLIIGLDNTILNVALPTLQREFDAAATELQWMVDAYILVFAGLLLTMGSLGDRFGRKRALQLGLIVFGASSLFAAYADSVEQLIAARAIMGVGGALIMPSTLSILIDVFPREERGRAISIWAGVAGMGIGLGPLTGGLLLENFWWGSIFLINIPIAVLALAGGLFVIPESRDPHPVPVDILGAVLSIAAITALVFAIIEAPARGWTDTLVLASFAAGGLLAIAFIIWEIKTDHPMLNLAFFRNLRFSAGAGAIAITFFAMFGMVFGLTQYLQFVQGYTALEAGVRLVPIALGVVIGAGNSHRLVAKLGTDRVVTLGLLLVTTVLASLAFWQPDTPYWVVGATLFVLAIGMGNTMAPSTDAVMGAIPEANAGVASAMNDVTRQVAGALGVAVIGSAINTVYGRRMEDAVTGLPPEAAEAASDSIGMAARIAAMVPANVGGTLLDAARSAFTDALSLAVLISACAALAGAVLIARFMPRHHLADKSAAPEAVEPHPQDAGAVTSK